LPGTRGVPGSKVAGADLNGLEPFSRKIYRRWQAKKIYYFPDAESGEDIFAAKAREVFRQGHFPKSSKQPYWAHALGFVPARTQDPKRKSFPRPRLSQMDEATKIEKKWPTSGWAGGTDAQHFRTRASRWLEGSGSGRTFSRAITARFAIFPFNPAGTFLPEPPRGRTLFRRGWDGTVEAYYAEFRARRMDLHASCRPSGKPPEIALPKLPARW